LQQKLQIAENEIQRLQTSTAISQPAEQSPELEQLRAELESTKQDLESARTAAANTQAALSSNADLAPVSQEVIEQRVADRKAELDAGFQAKEKALEEKFNERSEKMKTQLNAKLKESRERNQAAIDELSAAHAAELEQAKAVSSKNGISDVPQTSVKSEETATAVPAAGPTDPTAGMTEKQIQELVASNKTIMEIIKRNVQSRLKKSEDQWKAEFDQKTAEAQSTFEQQKKEAAESAKVLEGKRFGVKISMTERRAAAAQAKLDVVETAAKDTPQRPVVEVWNMAINAKPVANVINVAPGELSQAKPAATPQVPQQTQTAAAAANPFGAPSTTTGIPNPFGAPSNAPGSNIQAANPFATRGPSISGPSGIPQSASSLPVKPPQGRGQAQQNPGQSGIPRPGSSTGFYNQPGAGRGTGIPRGGRGGGQNSQRGGGNQRGGHNNPRGGHQQNVRGGAHGDAPASPLNPSAAQFAPTSGIPAPGTNKRPHDGAGGNAEKRPKQ
jgi:nucleoprotein TPR